MANDNLAIVLRILDHENHLVERADQKSISLLSILGVFMVFFIVYYRVIPINFLTGGLIVLYFLFWKVRGMMFMTGKGMTGRPVMCALCRIHVCTNISMLMIVILPAR